MGQKNIIMSDFYCTRCGNRGIPIWRKSGKEREAGHLKKLWCMHCNKETNHVECKPFTHYEYEDFVVEFEYANFTEKGQRKQSYGELRSKIHNGTVSKIKTLADGRDTHFGQN